jgi:hypothetical protein
MTLPNRDDATAAVRTSVWTLVIAFWLVLFIVAVTLALALAIWHLIGAF